MTDQPRMQTYSDADSGSAAATATKKAKEVAGEAGEQAKQVAAEVKEQVQDVAGDIKVQAREVFGQTRTEVRAQAEEGAKRLSGGIRTLGDQIQALRDGRAAEAGPVAGYADQARRKADEIASRLDRDGIDGVISDLSRFARRRPGMFLIACTGAGFALARLVRSQALSSADEAHHPSAVGAPSWSAGVSAPGGPLPAGIESSSAS